MWRGGGEAESTVVFPKRKPTALGKKLFRIQIARAQNRCNAYRAATSNGDRTPVVSESYGVEHMRKYEVKTT